MIKCAQIEKKEFILSKSNSPEDQLNYISMYESINDQFDPMKASQNAVQPWASANAKKPQTPVQYQKRLGLLRQKRPSMEKSITQFLENQNKTDTLGSFRTNDKKIHHMFIIRSKDKNSSRNMSLINKENSLSIKYKTPKKTQMSSTIDSFHENISKTESLKKNCVSILYNNSEYSHNFIPIHEAKKTQLNNLTEFYTTVKDEMTLKPVQAFIYPMSINHLPNRQIRIESKKMGRFELFVNNQKNCSAKTEKKARKLSLKKI